MSSNYLNEYYNIYKSILDDDYLNYWLLREECLKKYSFAIPDEGALNIISKYSPLVEVGAGSGY